MGREDWQLGGLYANLRVMIERPPARAKRVRELAATAMEGIDDDQLYMLIRLAMIDSTSNFINGGLAWTIRNENAGTFTIWSSNVGIVAFGLTISEAEFIVGFAARLYTRLKAGYDI